MTRREFGFAAHFIGGASCRYHRATQIGDLLISTVGDYFPRHFREDGGPQTIGHSRFYETMVFHVEGACECGCGLPRHNGREIDFAGYQTAAEADAGHEAMCAKYESIPTPVLPAGASA